MKTVLYSIPFGYFARNLLRTGVTERLLGAPGVRLALVTPAHADPAFVGEFAVNGHVVFEPAPAVRTDLTWPERVFWKTAVETWKRRALWPAHAGLRRLHDRLYPRLYAQPYLPLLDRLRPDLVITASPGNIAPMDAPLIRDAQARGIPTLCLVFSWDNLAGAKGLLPTRPDHLAVWNCLQWQEAIDLHFYRPEQVTVVGPTQFDLYQAPGTFDSREMFCRRLGLDPARKIVTVMVAGQRSSENTYIIDMLLAARASGRLPADTQLVCRPHPRVRPEKNRQAYARYAHRADVVLDVPDSYLDSVKWNPTRAEMRHLANTLKHSDVIVNIASTVTIEAAICDTPVVNLGFSTLDPEKFRRVIVERAWKYHYRYVRDSGSTIFAMDEEEAVAGVNRYLADPALHRPERKRLAEQLCEWLDGRSSERTAALILGLLEGAR